MWRYTLSNPNITLDDKKNIIDVLDSQWLSMGPRIREFEKLWCEKLNVKYALAVSSGTAALHLACLASGFKEGDEVIVPSLSFVATANAIKYTGAKPIFVDIDSLENPIISTEDILKKITSKTKGIIIMHYAGYTYELNMIKKIVDEKNLILIEDAAHSLLSTVDNKYLGTFGEIGCFSFYPNKNMTTGEGGMIVTDDLKKYEFMKELRSHGMTTNTWDRHNNKYLSYNVEELGFNYRMDEIRAAIGISQFKNLDKYHEYRKKLVATYREELKDIKDIEIPFLYNNTDSSNYIFTIRVLSPNLKARLIEYLNNNGVQTSFHYPPIHELDLYKKEEKVILPKTERICTELVTLPLHDSLQIVDIRVICNLVKSFFSNECDNNG